jgi:GT2 family glycosyltransferase
LHDFFVENTSLIKTLSDLDCAESQPALRPLSPGSQQQTLRPSPPGPDVSRAPILRRLGQSVPRAWVPVARRGLSGATAHLPAGVRAHLHRLLGLLRPDMGDIERDYPTWIALYDRIDDEGRRAIMADIARMPHPPLISVLMPVFNPPPAHLRQAIDSVRDQFYPWWELCIGDDASTDQAVIDILRDAAERDHRIKLVRRAQNGHISAASNSALRLATGAFVALLDHDDVLPPHALHEVALRTVADPDADIIYADEDHIDDHGRRSHPYFKPDWNPDLMLGQNLISHLGVYRRSLVERIGGFRTGFEGSQDYDLALRMVAETSPDRIVHIPKVLYHWRQGATESTFSQAAHDRCVENGRRAIREFVTRTHPRARVEPAPFIAAWTRVVYPVPDPAPLVSVIVSGGLSIQTLLECINVLRDRTDYPAVEILIAAEAAGIGDEIAHDARIRDLGVRVAAGPNQAAEVARGSMLLLLDADLGPDDRFWLREMVSHAIRPDVGAVGAKLLCTEGTVRHAGVAVGGPAVTFTPFLGRHRAQTGYFGHLQLTRDVAAVSGKCLMVRRQAFLDVGGLDEVLSLAAFGDVDLCLKLAESGYRTVWTPYAELTIRDETPRQRGQAAHFARAAARMRQRWGHKLEVDRFWSPNLAADPNDLGLAFPPRTGRSGPAPAASAGSCHADALTASQTMGASGAPAGF